MPKRLSLLLAASLAAPASLVLTGCGEQQSQSAFDEALVQIDAAEQGFVPSGGAGGEDAPTLAAYRQEALGNAAKTLDSVIQDGTPAQKIGAYRLRAEIDASAARHAAAQAAEAYAAITPQALQRSAHGFAAARAETRAGDTGGDQTSVINALREELNRQQTRKQELDGQVTQLESELQGHQNELQAVNTRRDEAVVQAGKLREQAFVASGDEQFRLEEESAAADRQGTLASAEGARKQLDIDMVTSRLNVAKSQQGLVDRLIGDLNARIAQASDRQQEFQTFGNEAREAQTRELGELETNYSQVWTNFNEQVDRPYTTAAQQTEAALRSIDAALAVQGADAESRNLLQLDRLNALTNRAELLVDHLSALSNFESALTLVSSTAGGQASTFQGWITQLRGKRGDVANLASMAIEAGRQAAQAAMGGGGNMNEAQKRAQQLEAYAKQVDTLKPKG